MMKRLLILLIFIFPPLLYSQDQIVLDSLLVKLQYAKEDRVKVAILRDLWKCSSKSDLLKSLDYALEALAVAKKNDDRYSIARSFNDVGVAYFRIGNYEESLKNHLKGLEILKTLPKEKEIVAAYNNLGLLYYGLENYDAALECYLNALNIHNERKAQNRSLDDSRVIHLLYNNIGNIYGERNDKKKAQQYYLKALEIALEIGDYYGQGLLYNNLGKLFADQKRFEEAEVFLQKSLEAGKKTNDQTAVAETYSVFADLYSKLKDYHRAERAAKKSLQLAKKVGALEIQMIAAKYLYSMYEQTADFEKAFETLRFYKEIADSLMNKKTIRELTQVQMKHEFEEKEKLREAEKQKRELRYGLIISILTLGFIITTLLYRLAKNRSRRIGLKKRVLEKDLELKNKELTTNVIYLVKKNELMNDVSSRLQKVKSSLQGEKKETIHQVVLDLQSEVDKDVWKEFEIRFEQVHNDFYKTLRERFPEITPVDEKLAAFLRLGMTTKEISAITHQSIKSLEVARTRLRKRLKLTNTEINLVTFLSQI